MLTAGPGEEGPGKSYLCQAWLWPLIQNEKWTIAGHCVSNQLSIIQGQILHTVGPPCSLWVPSSCLPFDRFLPIRATVRERVGRWRKGEDVKFRSVILWLFLRSLQKGGKHWLNQHLVYLGVLIHQGSASSFISMDNWLSDIYSIGGASAFVSALFHF